MNQMSYTKGVLLLALALVSATPIPVLAQGVVVEGRVFEAGGTASIWNARVELEGHGSTLTSRAGTFRFEDVEPGEYTLQVDAFGYDSESRVLAVDSATTVLVPLEIDPLPVDSLLVQAGTTDLDGLVRDPERDLLMVNVEILTNQVEGTQSDAHGRFTLDNVLEGVPIRVMVRPFGYLTVDTILVPDKDDERYVFEVEPDPWVEEMIAVQIVKLEERVAGIRAVGMRPMNRERLIFYAGTHTLGDAIDFEYRLGGTERITCVFIDEKEISVILPIDHFLQTTLPEELERVELLGFSMLRIYTREFIQEMFELELELRKPVIFPAIPLPVGDPTRCVR